MKYISGTGRVESGIVERGDSGGTDQRYLSSILRNQRGNKRPERKD